MRTCPGYYRILRSAYSAACLFAAWLFTAQAAPIKLYVDESRSLQLGGPVWSELRPPQGFFQTHAMALPALDLLKRYDVMIIRNQAEDIPYSEAELRAIRSFVENGGGLLLLGSPSIHTGERAVFRQGAFVNLRPLPPANYAANQLAAIFGVQFSNGSRPAVPSFQTTLPPTRGAATIKLGFAQPLSPLLCSNRSAHALIRAFGQPVAVACAHGKGRVIVCTAGRLFIKYGTQPDRKLGLTDDVVAAQQDLLIHWLRWLAQNSPAANLPATGYATWVEPETRLTGRNVEFYSAPPLRKQAEDLLAVWPAIWADFASHLGVSSPLEFAEDATNGRISPSDRLQVYVRAAEAGGISGGSKVSVSALGERWQMIGVLGHEAGHKLLGGCNVSISEAFAEWLASRAIRAAGYPREARGKIDQHVADFRAADPEGTKLDIADPLNTIKQSRACQGKWIWILTQLCDKHGETFIRDYVTALRKDVALAGPGRKLEGTERVRLTMKDHVDALSNASGRDLSHWFRQMGITVGEGSLRTPVTGDSPVRKQPLGQNR